MGQVFDIPRDYRAEVSQSNDPHDKMLAQAAAMRPLLLDISGGLHIEAFWLGLAIRSNQYQL
jgi:hypothetical protein